MTTPTLTPDPGAAHDRLYNRLPEHYRTADEQAGWPLYRWIAGITSQLGAVEALRDRIDYATVDDGGAPGDTSDLTDPLTADLRWLPWLAQLVGVQLRADLTDAEMRDAIRYASSGWRAGTKGAVADAAKTELTGTRAARVYDHTVFAPGDGGAWDVLIVTRPSETPDVTRVLRAVERRGAKPAGVVLHHRAYEASWDTVEASFPTWTDIRNAGSWNTVQEAGI